jgi:hypothetical protein
MAALGISWMRLTRRRFLELSAIGAVAGPGLAAGEGEGNAPESDIILGGGRYKNLDTGKVEHVLSIVDLRSKAVSLIELDFLAHGIHLHADQPYRLAIFEKKGPHAVELDLAERRVTRRITTSQDRSFYGHGVYSGDGKLLFCTETQLDDMSGVIAIRDAATLAYVGEFPSYGQEPHECRLIDDSRTMVVTNAGGDHGGKAPCVAYIDVASQRLIERVELTNTDLNTGHSAVGADGGLVVVSAPRRGLETTDRGGVSIRPAGKKMESIRLPREVTSRMQGEALSVAIQEEEEGIAAVTHPDGGMVTFWSVAERRLLKVLDLPHPRGVTLTRDGEFFVLSFGLETNLLKITARDLNDIDEAIVPNTFISGSHLYNWSRALTEVLGPDSRA